MQNLKEYEVEITQTLTINATVDATSPTEAKKKILEVQGTDGVGIGKITKIKVLGYRPIT